MKVLLFTNKQNFKSNDRYNEISKRTEIAIQRVDDYKIRKETRKRN